MQDHVRPLTQADFAEIVSQADVPLRSWAATHFPQGIPASLLADSGRVTASESARLAAASGRWLEVRRRSHWTRTPIP